MMHRLHSCWWYALIGFTLTIGSVSTVGADTIYSNIGPAGDEYSVSAGYTISGPSSSSSAFTQGNSFVPASTLALTGIELAAGLSHGTNELEVTIRGDAGGEPESILETFHFSDAMRPFDDVLRPLLQADSVLNPVLDAGATYWFIVAPGADDTDAGWYLNSIGARGPRVQYLNGVLFDIIDNDTQAAFRVSGEPIAAAVPEPGSLALCASGVFGVFLLRRLHHVQSVSSATASIRS